MKVYADTSFFARAYTPHVDSQRVLTWLQNAGGPLPFTPLHRHELRNAIRLRVFRGEITPEQRRLALEEIESDLADQILAHTPIPWTEAFRESEIVSAAHTEKLGTRGFDVLHVGLALALNCSEFLTYDARQESLAVAAGLRVRE